MKQPIVEIHVQTIRAGAAAAGTPEGKLSQEQLAAVQVTINNLVAGFKPPAAEGKKGEINLDSVEIELGFKLELSSGDLLKLIFASAKGEASITAKATWKRS
jgi:hypothetical protein